MLNNKLILELNKNVLKRFEPNLDSGTVFLFNMANETSWSGNAAVDCFLRLLDGKNNLEQIYKYLLEIFEGFSEKQIIDSYDEIIKTLIEKGFLVIKNES